MKKFGLLARGAVFGAVALASAGTFAVPVTPTSYTFIPTAKQGSYVYLDETGKQLTDGVFGANLLVDQAAALPYVGWNATQVTINFNFAELTTFNSVSVSSLQAWVGNIALPDVYLSASVDGVNWVSVASLITKESSVNNYQKKSLTLADLSIEAQYLQIDLKRNAIGPWIFVDEVTFEGSNPTLRLASVTTTAVPEPGSTIALMAIGFGSLVFFGRRK